MCRRLMTERAVPPPWQHYCSNVAAAVRFARARQASVVVVSQPRMLGELAERHASQQRALAAMLARDFAGEPRLRYVDASDAVDLSSQAVTFDGLHLNRDGNMRVAARLLEPIRSLVNPAAALIRDDLATGQALALMVLFVDPGHHPGLRGGGTVASAIRDRSDLDERRRPDLLPRLRLVPSARRRRAVFADDIR